METVRKGDPKARRRPLGPPLIKRSIENVESVCQSAVNAAVIPAAAAGAGTLETAAVALARAVITAGKAAPVQSGAAASGGAVAVKSVADPAGAGNAHLPEQRVQVCAAILHLYVRLCAAGIVHDLTILVHVRLVYRASGADHGCQRHCGNRYCHSLSSLSVVKIVTKLFLFYYKSILAHFSSSVRGNFWAVLQNIPSPPSVKKV